MSKKKDAELAAIIIPENEYQLDLEEKVAYYMSICEDLPVNKVKPQRTKPIETRDPHEKKVWEREEIRRCMDGHFGMSGPYYFFYNYCKLWDIENGLIRPEFRFAQNEFFRHIRECQDSREWGVISVKRRRVGASWMVCADILWDCIFTPFFKVGMTSKTEADAKELFKKIKFLYDNLPEFLQAEIFSQTVNSIEFATKGDKKKKSGIQSEVVVKAPTETSWEGFALKKLVIDEAAKLPGNLKALYSLANETMRVGTQRVGTPVIFGCVCAGTKVWINDGSLINIEDLKPEYGILGYNGTGVSQENIPWHQPPAEKECVRITTNTGRTLECSTDHPILWSKKGFGSTYELPKSSTGNRVRRKKKETEFKEALDIKVGEQVAVIEEVPIYGTKVMWEPRVVGWLIGDGTYGIDNTPKLSNCEYEINDYVDRNFSTSLDKTYITKLGKVYKETRIKGICPILRDLGIYGQTKLKKRLPVDIHSYRKEDICELLGGILDTDGYSCFTLINRNVSIAQASFEILDEIRILFQKIGVHGTIHRIKMNPNNPKDRNDHFRYTISDGRSLRKLHQNVRFFVRSKQDNLEKIVNYYENRKERQSKYITGIRFERVTKVENIGMKPIYNLTAGVTNTYIANGIVTHNTAGDIGKDGKDMMEMWYNSDVYKLKKFFFAGYMGLIVDDYGNDMKEHAIRWIVYERKRKESLSAKELTDFIQQYPLTVEEAFKSSDEGGLGNRIKIEKQRVFLMSHPMPFKKGSFRPNANGHPVFSPDPRGACVIYEEPDAGQRNLYLSGVDPTDHVSESKKTSSLSMFIMSKPVGIQPPKIVFKYTDRPVDPRDFYEQAFLALKYYGECRVLIERNKYGMIQYFEEKGFKHLLAGEPQGIKKYVPKVSVQPGYYKTQYTTQYGEELIEQYIEDYYEVIPCVSLLDQFDQYGIQNCDEVDAFMACLMFMKDDKEKVRAANEMKNKTPNWSYKYVGGKLQITKK